MQMLPGYTFVDMAFISPVYLWRENGFVLMKRTFKAPVLHSLGHTIVIRYPNKDGLWIFRKKKLDVAIIYEKVYCRSANEGVWRRMRALGNYRCLSQIYLLVLVLSRSLVAPFSVLLRWSILSTQANNALRWFMNHYKGLLPTLFLPVFP